MRSLQLISILLALFLCPPPIFAQPSPVEPQSLPAASAPTNSLEVSPSSSAFVSAQLNSKSALQSALEVSPPQRKAAGKALAESAENMAEIDRWIESTPIDHPDNLKLKDLLLAMPLTLGGPRLAALAKKTADPAIQRSWLRWLSKYPEVHQSVLLAWIKNARQQPDHFAKLLLDYAELNPNAALDIWVQLRANHTESELAKTADFGVSRSGCANALSEALSENRFEGEIASLRLFKALSSCQDASTFKNFTNLNPKLIELLNHKLPSRRIVGLDAVGSLRNTDPTLVQRILQIFADAQNTTERAHALRALQYLQPETQATRLTDALTQGDDTLRLEAATLLAMNPQHGVDLQVIQSAFEAEKWTDTQFALYQVIAQSMPNGEEKSRFQKSILFDDKRATPLRTLALQHLISTDATAITLEDMAKLTTAGAPIDLIAGSAEHIYASQPQHRPTLRKWLIAQQPFERRLLSSFVAFLRVDTAAKDLTASETVLEICSKATEQENILQPCIFYLSEHAQKDNEKALLESLQNLKKQHDAMANFEF